MRNILIVEDSHIILSSIQAEIEKYKFIKPFFATNYKDATKLIREHQGDFQAALLDLNLPDAQNGEIVKLANSHKIPVVILTTNINENLKDTILQKNVVDYVLKTDPSSIMFAINSIFRTLNNYETTILVVENSKLYRDEISNTLKQIHLNILEATNGKEALDILNKRDDISLVITNYQMPIIDGLELTYRIRQTKKKDEIAIIAFSSIENRDIIHKFLKFGANDFINKPFTHNEIITRINVNLELLELFAKVKDMANRDFLTQAYNRRYFFNNTRLLFTNNKKSHEGEDLAIAMIDIDNFKTINDTYGHHIGDIAIKEVKTILDKHLRKSDLMARFGGEEFCVLLDNIKQKNVQLLFDRIRKAFEKNTISMQEIQLSYTVSIGICYGKKSSIDDMIKVADSALYEAKKSGKNRVVLK